jgi:predicted enzyme related to lactoylglutathione lyase
MPSNTVCHIEWACTDLEKTRSFLAGLFGWKFTVWSDEYMMFKAPGGPGGGISKVDKVEPGNTPAVYVEVDSIEPCLQMARELGGAVVLPRTAVSTIGYMAHLTDPDGGIVGLFEAKKRG